MCQVSKEIDVQKETHKQRAKAQNDLLLLAYLGPAHVSKET
jgi:hypothetical protein